MKEEKNPLLSIIVPIYNVEKYLKACLDSILNQTFKDFELILINDGSQDNCGDICEEYKKRDPRIITIHQENKGVSAARNIGIKLSRGEYISFVDPDDEIECDMYENLLSFTFNNSVDIVVCQIRTINTISGIESISNLWRKTNIVIEKEEIKKHLIPDVLTKGSYSLLSSVNKVYKKHLLKEISQFDENMDHGEDARLNLILLQYINKIVFLDKDLYCYYIRNEESLTKKIRDNFFKTIKDNKDFGLFLCQKYGVMNVEKDYWDVFMTNTLNYIQEIALSNYSNRKKIKIIKDIINDKDYKYYIKRYSAPSIFYFFLIVFTRIRFTVLIILLINLKSIIRRRENEN